MEARFWKRLGRLKKYVNVSFLLAWVRKFIQHVTMERPHAERQAKRGTIHKILYGRHRGSQIGRAIVREWDQSLNNFRESFRVSFVRLLAVLESWSKKIIDDLEQKSEDYRRIKSWCITKFENTKRKLHKLYEAWKDLGHFLARLREVPDKAEYDHKVESLKTHLKQLHKILTKIISRFFFNIFKSMVQRIAHKLMKWKNNFFI